MKRLETILRHITRYVKSGDKIRIKIVGKTEEGKDTALFEKDTCVLEIGERTKGLLRPALDRECLNMKLNQVKHFVIRPGDASHPQSYRDPDLCVTHRLPPGVQRPQIGFLAQIRHENRIRLAKVTKVQGDHVTMDMNDPLAGHVLNMTIRIESFLDDDDDDKNVDERSFPEPFVIPSRTFNLKSLSRHDGTNRNGSIYIAVRDLVYDVTEGRKFYGKEGMYGFMAGKDATVCLAKFSLNPKWVNHPWKGTLTPSETETLRGYVRTMIQKYPCVGRLVLS